MGLSNEPSNSLKVSPPPREWRTILLSKSFSAGFGGQGRNIPLSLPKPAFFRLVINLPCLLLARLSTDRHKRTRGVPKSSPPTSDRDSATLCLRPANQARSPGGVIVFREGEAIYVSIVWCPLNRPQQSDFTSFFLRRRCQQVPLGGRF